MLYKNPKLMGSKIVDAVPVAGKCPLDCPDCYGNRPGAFYAPLDEVILPSADETEGKVVRVNSRNDSNVHRAEVIRLTDGYQDRFFNTSIPDMDFPAPVVFTCNGRDIDGHFYRLEDISNLMFVRVKTNSWNLDLVDDVVRYYTYQRVPVVLTTMNYYTESLVKRKEDYEWKVHVTNPYWRLKDSVWRDIWMRYISNGLVFSCGNTRSTLCRDCHNCYWLYWAHKRGYSTATLRMFKAVQAINFDPVFAGGKNVFLICPVRNVTQKQEEFMKSHIDRLKHEGKSVHWPLVDTDQTGSEWDICLQNGRAILACDEVHVFWEPESEGSKFDLGMAFMLNLIKGFMGMHVPVTVINPGALGSHRGMHFVDIETSKSFESLLAQWEQAGSIGDRG